MKLLIADDEPLARERLKALIADIDKSIEVVEASNGLEVLEQMPDFDPDIVLMDIKMPGMDGLEAAQQLSQLNNPPAIIFTTAYDQFALAAFDTRAIAYLLKPIRKEDLKKKILACYLLNKPQQQMIAPQEIPHLNICIKTKDKVLRIAVENICYFSADQKYVKVVYSKDNEIKENLLDKTLKQLELDFKGIFIRIHHKTLVKIKLLDNLKHQPDGKYLLQLSAIKTRFEVSRRHVAEVKKLLKSM